MSSQDVRCLKSCSSELTGIPLDCPYLAFHRETVSASSREAKTVCLAFTHFPNLFISPLKLKANIKGQIKMQKVITDLCTGFNYKLSQGAVV